jgi:hypothetical protein
VVATGALNIHDLINYVYDLINHAYDLINIHKGHGLGVGLRQGLKTRLGVGLRMGFKTLRKIRAKI